MSFIVPDEPVLLFAASAVTTMGFLLGIAFTLGAIASRITAECAHADSPPAPGRDWYG